MVARSPPSAGEPWLITTSGCFPFPGGRNTVLSIRSWPLVVGMRQSCSRMVLPSPPCGPGDWANAGPQRQTRSSTVLGNIDLSPAAPRRLAAPSRAGAHAAEDAAVLHLAEMYAD